MKQYLRDKWIEAGGDFLVGVNDDNQSQEYAEAWDTQLEEFVRLIAEDCQRLCEESADNIKYSYTPAKAKVASGMANHLGDQIKRYIEINYFETKE